MHASPDPGDVDLYQRAAICKAFPAYKLHELRDLPGGYELLRAMELMNLANKANG